MGAEWWATLAVLALAVLVADRVAARRRPRRDDATRDPLTSVGGPGLGEVVEIFQPTARYLYEERERQRHELVQPGDADKDWDLDLDGGTARRPEGPVRDAPS